MMVAVIVTVKPHLETALVEDDVFMDHDYNSIVENRVILVVVNIMDSEIYRDNYQSMVISTYVVVGAHKEDLVENICNYSVLGETAEKVIN